jgi:hypothetical protein
MARTVVNDVPVGSGTFLACVTKNTSAATAKPANPPRMVTCRAATSAISKVGSRLT